MKFISSPAQKLRVIFELEKRTLFSLIAKARHSRAQNKDEIYFIACESAKQR